MTSTFLILLWFLGPLSQIPVPPPPTTPTQAVGVTQPTISNVAPLGFQLGPGDVLEVTAWNGNETDTRNITVAADGTIMIPFGVNKLVRVSGLTSIQVRDIIQDAMRVNYRDPRVQVVQSKIESKKAGLAGEVYHPGL